MLCLGSNAVNCNGTDRIRNGKHCGCRVQVVESVPLQPPSRFPLPSPPLPLYSPGRGMVELRSPVVWSTGSEAKVLLRFWDSRRTGVRESSYPASRVQPLQLFERSLLSLCPIRFSDWGLPPPHHPTPPDPALECVTTIPTQSLQPRKATVHPGGENIK